MPHTVTDAVNRTPIDKFKVVEILDYIDLFFCKALISDVLIISICGQT
jgi:hypothetical protein